MVFATWAEALKSIHNRKASLVKSRLGCSWPLPKLVLDCGHHHICCAHRCVHTVVHAVTRQDLKGRERLFPRSVVVQSALYAKRCARWTFFRPCTAFLSFFLSFFASLGLPQPCRQSGTVELSPQTRLRKSCFFLHRFDNIWHCFIAFSLLHKEHFSTIIIQRNNNT